MRDDLKTIRVAVNKPKPQDDAIKPWFFSPRLAGVLFAPDSFRDRLKSEMGEELDATWNPILERWQLWMKAPQVSNKLCAGWKLLFIHNGPDGGYLPLDERVFARLYSASVAKWGSGKKYMEHILAEMDREKAAYEKKATADAIDASMPYYDHSQISISMRGQSNGSKFADYLS